MGCDIHFVIESKTDNGWVGVFSTDEVYSNMPAGCTYENGEKRPITYIHFDIKGRNYKFFGLLANVRDDGPEPLGEPEDMSQLAELSINSWGEDGHSHSYCSLEDFCVKRAIADAQDDGEVMRKRLEGTDRTAFVQEYFPNITEDSIPITRVVYWFDN